MTTTRQRGTLFCLLLALLLFAAAVTAQAPTPDVYVDAVSGSNANDGFSWGTAKASIGAALDVLSGAGTVHVAEGTYEESVLLEGGIWMLGGYPSGGGPRNPASHSTWIDGYGDSGVVIRGGTGPDAARLDGFRITGSSPACGRGGGIRQESGQAVITNNVITGNTAAHITSWAPGNCRNTAYEHAICKTTCTGLGGGLYIGPESGRTEVVNNLLRGNRILDVQEWNPYDPGCVPWSTAQLLGWDCDQPDQCTRPRRRGTGIYVAEGAGDVVLSQTTVVDNLLCEDAGSCRKEEQARLDTLAGQIVTLSHNIAGRVVCEGAGSFPSMRNLADSWTRACGHLGMHGDPLFVDPDGGDYHLSHVDAGQSEQSPAVDAGTVPASSVCIPGDPDRCMSAMTTRTDGVPDIGAVDLGYHYWGPDLPPPLPRRPEGFPRGDIRTPMLRGLDGAQLAGTDDGFSPGD